MQHTSSPTLPARRLDSIKKIRQELARVYRDARAGILPTGDASRLAFILVSLAKLVAESDLENRVSEIERTLEDAPDANTHSTPTTH